MENLAYSSNEDLTMTSRNWYGEVTGDAPTIFVFGANSFSGQDFVDLLLARTAYRVVGISRSPERHRAFMQNRMQVDSSRYQYHTLDMNRDRKTILDLLDTERPAGIVNFAAQGEVASSWRHPGAYFQTNLVALAELMEHLYQRDYVKRYLHVSTPEVYGTCVGRVSEDHSINPSTPYAASKAAADMLLKMYHDRFQFPLLTVRATNVYGAGQQLYRIIPRSVIYLLLGRTIELHGGGKAVKTYIHIRDVSRGELDILERGRVGQIYHLSSDDSVSIRDVVADICRRMKIDFDKAVRTVEERPGQDAAYVIDSTKARSELGWAPQIPLHEGLDEVIKWIHNNFEEIKTLSLDYTHRE